MDEEQSLTFNLEESDKLSGKPIYRQYKQWLSKNGVLLDPSIMYPAYFGIKNRGVVGVAATKALPGGQAIIAVPYDLIITVPKVKEQPQLSKIIQQNPHLFKISDESAFSILTLYVCSQLIKGNKSFYAPYFKIGGGVSLANGWTHWDMLAVENSQVIRLLKSQAEEIEGLFLGFLTIFRRYPNVFPQQITNTQYKQMFEKAYNFICTRAFGWSLPSISLIPMADSLNHNNDYVTHMLIDTKLQKQPHQMYTVKGKKYNLSLLSKIDSQLPKSQPSLRKKHKIDKFIQKHKQILAGSNKKDSQNYILWQQYKAGVRNFRQLHFYEQSCEQDNDTDQEQIEKFQFQYEKFRFYEKYESPGITQKNKISQLTKYWKIFLDSIFDEQQDEDQQEQEQKIKQKKVSQQQKSKIKKKFEDEAKQSEGSSLVSSSSSSDSDDQQFKWMAGNPQSHNHKTTYFIMATRKPIKKNEQLFNFYGRRSNRFLLVGYNFILQDNKYDSLAFRINIDNWKANSKAFAVKIPVPKIINRGGKLTTYVTKQIRLKRQRVNIELINHCRALLIGWWEDKNQMANKKVRITIPFSIEFEKKVLNLAAEFIKTLQKQYMTSLQEDQQLYQKAQKHESQSAIKIRINYKQILNQQLQMIKMCQQSLKAWKNNKININSESQMLNLRKIRSYICSLERAKLQQNKK